MIFIKFTKVPPFFAEFLRNLENDAKISFWKIPVVAWPPHADNLVIPIGILMFLSLQGGREKL